MKNLIKRSFLASTVLAAGAAHADLSTAAVTEITAVGTDITAVGVAIIGLAAVALGVRWVKASFF